MGAADVRACGAWMARTESHDVIYAAAGVLTRWCGDQVERSGQGAYDDPGAGPTRRASESCEIISDRPARAGRGRLPRLALRVGRCGARARTSTPRRRSVCSDCVDLSISMTNDVNSILALPLPVNTLVAVDKTTIRRETRGGARKPALPGWPSRLTGN